jgi:hypothetical protein
MIILPPQYLRGKGYRDEKRFLLSRDVDVTYPKRLREDV